MYSEKEYFHVISVSPKLPFQAQVCTVTRSFTPCAGQSLEITLIESGFPHSEICGSKVVRTSPQLIAAYHVLHRLSMPRHPPNALKALDCSHHRCPHSTCVIGQEKTSLLRRHRINKAALACLLWVAPGSGANGDDLLTMTNSSVHSAYLNKRKPRSFFECILVEPDGIEPTT